MSLVTRRPLPLGLTALTLLALTTVAKPGQAIVRRDDVADSLYLNYGSQSQFIAAGTNGVYIGEGTGGFSYVLTASHLGNFGTFTLGGVNYAVQSHTYFDPAFNLNTDLLKGTDLQILKLKTNVTGVLAAKIYGVNDEVGKLGSVIGYGNTGTGLTGEVAGTGGQKRGATNYLDANGSQVVFDDGHGHGVTASSRILLTDFDKLGNPSLSTFGDTAPTALEGSFGGGDSGNGTFIQVGGQYYLAGIHSFSAFDKKLGEYGSLTGDTRLSSFSDFIFRNTGIRTVTAVPEASSVASFALLSGLGALGMIRLRRARR